MSSIARRFRVSHWTHNYQNEGDEGAMTVTTPTNFTVQLLNLTMDGIEKLEGTVVVALDTTDGLTGENHSAIRAYLLERKILDDGGAQDNSGSASALSVAKAIRWGDIVAIRDGMETKGFPYLDYWFDSDVRSAARINTTAQAAMAAAMMGEDFSTEWTSADSHVVTMTREQVIGMPVAFAMHADTLHKKARDLRLRIDAATTIAEVQQCYWEGVESAPPPQPAPLEGGEPPPVEAVA